MTVLDRLRSGPNPSDRSDGDPSGSGSGPWVWLGPLIAGFATSAVSAALVILLGLAVVLTAVRSTVGWDTTVGTGAALWLLGGGARIEVDSVRVALTPLLLTLVLVGACAVVAGRTLPRGGERRRPAGAWILGYAAAGLVVTALTNLAPAAPVAWSVVLPVLAVPGAGVALVYLRRGDLREVVGGRLPRSVVRSVRPAREGTLLLVALGALLVLASVTVHAGRVTHATSELGAGSLGTAVLWAGQASALPNVALWAVSFLAGPGFSVTDGAHVSWSGAESGLMPLVPLFAALPSPGDFPWLVHLVVLAPVGVGVVVGWRSLRSVPRLSPTRAKAGVALLAAVGVGGAVTLLDALGGGSLGTGRLVAIGAPTVPLGVMVAGEVAAGALLPVVREWWTLRR